MYVNQAIILIIYNIYTFIYSRDKRRKKELEKKNESEYENEYNVENDRRKQHQYQ